MNGRAGSPRLPYAVSALLFLLSACSSEPAAKADVASETQSVTALGRVTPGRAVMAISAQPGARLLRVDVRVGQRVRRGHPLAFLADYPLRRARLQAAIAQLTEAQERLAASTRYNRALVEQNRSNVQLAEVALDQSERDVARVATLTARGALPQQRLVDEQYEHASRTAELGKARAEYSAAEAAAQRARSEAGIRSAQAAVETARAEMELTIVRAPLDGEILRIFTYAGERIGESPILNMSDTRDMNVVAAVYETDIRRVRLGQRATITSPALPQPIAGRVEEIGALVYRNDLFALDPNAPRDTRVVEVRIGLEPSAAAQRLSNLEVTVRIDTTSAS